MTSPQRDFAFGNRVWGASAGITLHYMGLRFGSKMTQAGSLKQGKKKKIISFPILAFTQR